MSYSPNLIVPCATGDFTSFGTGLTAVNTAFGVNLTKAGNGTAHNLSGLYKAAPGTPYTITVPMQWNGSNKEYTIAGIGWSDGTGYVWMYAITNDPGGGGPTGQMKIGVGKYTNTTTFSADYLQEFSNVMASDILWFRIKDDGTNRICYFSKDGVNFFQFHSIGRTDFLTPTRNVLIVNPYSTAINVTYAGWQQT